jgi:uncharacterized membrane protein (UPF0127 family)
LRKGALFDSASDLCLVAQVMLASAWWDRARGLLGKPPLKSGQGLLISPCKSIHTFGMRYPIDVVFLDANWTVCKIISSLPMARFSGSMVARMTLELPANEASRIQLSAGSRLVWRESIA